MPKRIKSFQVLGRLFDMELDQLRLKLSDLQGQRDIVDDKITKLKESELMESSIALKYPVESFTLPIFGAYTKANIEILSNEIKGLDSQINDCLNDVRYHFQESKKVELAKNKEIMQHSKLQKKQEQLFYDQIAESRHHRDKKQPID